MKKVYCILTTAHAIDDVRVYRRMALSLVTEFDIIWIGPDVHVFENELNNEGIQRILYKNGKGITGRLLNNFHALKLFNKHRNSISFVYFPDPDIAFLHTLFYRTKKFRRIFDIHEVYHKYLLNRRVKGPVYSILNSLIKKAISLTVRNADLTLAVSETVANYYVSEKNPGMIIRNCLPLNFGHPEGNHIIKKEIFTIVHGKNHPSRGTLILLDAVRIMKKKGINCKVLMINTKNELYDEYVDKYELASFIDLHEGLPFVEMISQMLICHAGIIAYGRDLGVDSLPNRIFEYMALGLPVLVPRYSPEMVKIVEQENCGLVIDTEDPNQIAECIDSLVKDSVLSDKMGEMGRTAFRRRHNWETEILPFINFLKYNV